MVLYYFRINNKKTQFLYKIFIKMFKRIESCTKKLFKEFLLFSYSLFIKKFSMDVMNRKKWLFVNKNVLY